VVLSMSKKQYPCEIPNFIELSLLSFEPSILNQNRFVIDFTFNDRDKSLPTAIVILKNPSTSLIGSTQELKNLFIDETTDNVLTFLHSYPLRYPNKKFKRIIILNLFPCYSSNPNFINSKYNFNFNKFDEQLLLVDDLETNRKYIYNIVKQNIDSLVICAWGGYGDEGQVIKEYYDKQIELVMGDLFTLKAQVSYVSKHQYKINMPFHPMHGRAWDLNEHIIYTPR